MVKLWITAKEIWGVTGENKDVTKKFFSSRHSQLLEHTDVFIFIFLHLVAHNKIENCRVVIICTAKDSTVRRLTDFHWPPKDHAEGWLDISSERAHLCKQ